MPAIAGQRAAEDAGDLLAAEPDRGAEGEHRQDHAGQQRDDRGAGDVEDRPQPCCPRRGSARRSARSSMRTTGSRTVTTVAPSPGCRVRAPAPSSPASPPRSRCSAPPPGSRPGRRRDRSRRRAAGRCARGLRGRRHQRRRVGRSSRRLIQEPNTGPAMITRRDRDDQAEEQGAARGRRPRRRWRPAGRGAAAPGRAAPTGRPAPGCRRAAPAASLRRATSSTIGTSSTTPTSKNSGMPMSAATPAIAHGSRPARTPGRRTASTTRSAPPDSASRPPIMAPSAMSRPTLPTVAPTPVVKLVIVSAAASPATTPSTADPRISARNGCTFSQVISRTTAAMPRMRGEDQLGVAAGRVRPPRRRARS